ncbi:MAG TPA: M1 family aminopeptidase [Bacteroidota bacterium]
MTALLFLIPWVSRSADEKGDGYRIVAHQAMVRIFPGQNALSCSDTLTIRLSGRRGHITLRLLPVFDVEGVAIGGRSSRFKREGDSLRLDDIPPDTLLRCAIRYSGVLAFRSDVTLLTKDRAVLREEEFLPHGNSELEEVRLGVVVPAGWEAQTVGTLIRREELKDSTLYLFELKKPIPTLGWICAGKYRSSRDDSSGYPVSVHLFDEDSADAGRILRLAGKVLNYYSRTFSPYRFPDLKIVEVEDWLGGGAVLAAAIPTMVLIKKVTLHSEDRFNQVRTILPHEIAHQWWPMTVFNDDVDAALLSEGMCDYSALLFNESMGTLSVRDSLKHHPLLRSLILRAEQGRDLPLQRKADLRSLPTHYLKASYIHHMLRHILGDSAFIRLYREYASRFGGKHAGLDDFRRLSEEISGRTLDWFFEQWVKNRGIPRLKIYNVKSSAEGGRWSTRGRVRVVGYEKYTALVDVGVQSPAGIQKTSVWLGKDTLGVYRNDVPFEIISSVKPDRAVLDPDGDLLLYQKLPVTLSDLRDPADGLLVVGTRGHAAELMALAQKDSAEMSASSWSISIKRDVEVTLGDLQSERVFLYGKASENSAVAELASKFPIGFRGDSVEIPGGFRGPGAQDTGLFRSGTIFDSTLTLLQCIESPYLNRGVLVWVAPLSVLAKPALSPYEHSWVIARGKNEIGSGIWEVKDGERVVEIR